MEEFLEYWNEIPNANADVGVEFALFMENDKKSNFSTVALLYLQKNVQEYPYPTYKILKCLDSPKNPEITEKLEQISYNALEKMLNSDKKLNERNLYALLCIIQLSENLTEKITVNLLPILAEMKFKQSLNSKLLYLALIARTHNCDILLRNFLKLYRHILRTRTFEIDLKTFYLGVLHEHRHWILELLPKIEFSEIFFRKPLVDHLKLIQLLYDLKSTDEENKISNQNLDSFCNEINIDNFKNENLKFCALELSKRRQLFTFVGQLSEKPKKWELTSKGLNTLASILSNIEVTAENFHQFQSYFIMNYVQLFKHQTAISKTEDFSEIDFTFLNQYILVKLCIDRITTRSPFMSENEFNAVLLATLKSLKISKEVVQAIDAILMSLFIQSNSFNQHKNQVYSKFVCDKVTLKSIMDSLTTVLNELPEWTDFKTLDSDSPTRFNYDNTMACIRNATEKFAVLEGFPRQKIQKLNTEDWKHLVQHSTHNKKPKETVRPAISSSRFDFYCEMVNYASQDSISGTTSDNELSADCEQLYSKRNFISLMLMTSESQIHVCLHNNNLQLAKKVLENHNLQNTVLSSEIDWLENLQDIRSKLANFRSNQSVIVSNESLLLSEFEEVNRIEDTIKTFIQSVRKAEIQSDSDKEFIKLKNCEAKYLRQLYDISLSSLLIMDLMVSLPFSLDCCHSFYNQIVNHREVYYGFGKEKFLENMIDCMTAYKNNTLSEVTIPQLLKNEIYPLKCETFLERLQKLNEIVNLLNGEHSSCSEKHLKAQVDIYTKNARELLNIHSPNQKWQTNEILALNFDNIICDLVILKSITPEKLLKTVTLMKLNLAHSLAMVSIQVINHKETETSKTQGRLLNIGNASVLHFIKKESFLVAYLIKEVHDFEYRSLIYEDSYNLLENLRNLAKIKKLASLFDNNTMMCSLCYDCLGMESLKKILSDPNLSFDSKLQIIEAVSPLQYRQDKAELDELKNSFIEDNLENLNDVLHYIVKVTDLNKKVKMMLKHQDKILDINELQDLLETIFNMQNWVTLDINARDEIIMLSAKIKVYKEILKSFEDSSSFKWQEIKHFSEKSPDVILQEILIRKKNHKLTRDWMGLHTLQENGQIQEIFLNALNVTTNEEEAAKIFHLIEMQDFADIVYKSLLPKVRKIYVLAYIIDYLKENMQNYRISLEILSSFNSIEDHVWSLIHYPLLIIEQCLMNMKMEILSKVLRKIKPLLSCNVCVCSSLSEKLFSSIEVIKFNDSLEFSIHKHENMPITSDCIDLLLKLYASKALEFKILDNSTIFSNDDREKGSTASTKLLVLPSKIPTKSEWIPDSAAVVCMVCNVSKFTLLNRRHHCRRCGRVCCSSCSKNRIKLPEMYYDLLVRICLDCVNTKENQSTAAMEDKSSRSSIRSNSSNRSNWHLSGDIDHDNTIRDDFSYEFAPNVGLCLAICDLHTANDNLAQFLLYNFQRLKLLVKPTQKANSEIDYLLVAQMLKVLAVSAKKYERLSHNVMVIIDQADIILSLIRNGCEKLMPTEPMDTNTLRKLRDSLVRAEKFDIAMNLSLKCGFSKDSVLAAWGISCLRAGMFITAREKFKLLSHNKLSLIKVKDDLVDKDLIASLESLRIKDKCFKSNRPNKSTTLLIQIKNILENLLSSYKKNNKKESTPNLEEVIREKLKQKDVNFSEPAVNIKENLNLSNLKNIASGCIDSSSFDESPKSSRSKREIALKSESCYFEELIYYLGTYGGNIEIVNFLVENQFLKLAIKFVMIYDISPEIFVKQIYCHEIKRGNTKQILDYIHELSPDFTIKSWKKYLIETCKYLEQNRLYNCLYNLQKNLHDPIRAAMTCVKFYTDKCLNFTDLQNHAFHLKNAEMHLQKTMEKFGLDLHHKNVKSDQIATQDIEDNHDDDSFFMKWDLKTINMHINTINRQIELTKFLGNAERTGKPTLRIIHKIHKTEGQTQKLPTLFGSQHEKMKLAVLVMVCGENVEEGFGLSYRIIQDFSLKYPKVCEMTASYLGSEDRIEDVLRLLNCIKSNDDGTDIKTVCDLTICAGIHAVFKYYKSSIPSSRKQLIENLVNQINDLECRVKMCFETRQLKNAYLLAVQIDSKEYLKKIYRQAEADKNYHILKLCQKKLDKESDKSSEMSSSFASQA